MGFPSFQFEVDPQVGKLFSSGIITYDCETINGEWQERITVLGKVTFEIMSVCLDNKPV